MASMIKAMRYHVAENLRVTMMKARTKLIYSDNDPMIQDVPTSYSARPLSSQYIDRDGNPVPTATRGMIGEDPYMEQQPQQQQQQHRFLPPGSSSLSKRRRRRKRVPTAADQEDIIEEAAAIEEEEDPEGVDNTMQIQSDRHSQAYRRHHNQLQQHHSPEQQQQPAQVQVEEEPKFPSMGNQIRVVTDDEDVGTRERRRSKEEQELNADEGSEDEGEGDEEGEEEEDNEEEEGDEEEDGDEGNSSRSSSRSSSNSSQEDVSSNRSVTSSRDPSGKWWETSGWVAGLDQPGEKKHLSFWNLT